MTEKHSFFIPDAEFITDLEGLVVYLGQFCAILCVFVLSFFIDSDITMYGGFKQQLFNVVIHF